MKEKIYEIVKKNVVNLGIEKDILIFKEAVDSTPLYGKDGKLDSLSLIRLSVEIEENINEELDKDISIVDDRAMSQSRSPFRTIESLCEYIYSLINEEL